MTGRRRAQPRPSAEAEHAARVAQYKLERERHLTAEIEQLTRRVEHTLEWMRDHWGEEER